STSLAPRNRGCILMIPFQGDSSASSGRGDTAVPAPVFGVQIPLFFLLALCILSAPRPASAYGALGHKVVGALAEGMLTPRAEARIRILLGTAADGTPASLASASTWADEIRMLRPETRPWHYVTLQIAAPRYDSVRADPANLV